jgi:hypothetical protein
LSAELATHEVVVRGQAPDLFAVGGEVVQRAGFVRAMMGGVLAWYDDPIAVVNPDGTSVSPEELAAPSRHQLANVRFDGSGFARRVRDAVCRAALDWTEPDATRMADMADGPYEEGAEFGIRWCGHPYRCDPGERQAWAILRAMWPPEHLKETPVEFLKQQLGSAATHPKWGTNNAVAGNKILARVKLGFDLRRAHAGVEILRWLQVTG